MARAKAIVGIEAEDNTGPGLRSVTDGLAGLASPLSAVTAPLGLLETGLKGATVAGAGLLAGMTALVTVNSEYARSIDLVARGTNASWQEVETASRLFQRLGADLDDVRDGFTEVQIKIGDASDAASEQAKSFRALNLEVEHLQDLSPADQFWEVIDALGDVEGPMQQYHGDIILGGDLWQRMASLAGESIDEQVEKLREMNTIMSDSQIEQGLIFEANTNRMQSAMTGIGNTITEFLYPHFVTLSNVGAAAFEAIAVAIYGGGEEGEGGLGVLPAVTILENAFVGFFTRLSPNARNAVALFAVEVINGMNTMGPKVAEVAREIEKKFKEAFNNVGPFAVQLMKGISDLYNVTIGSIPGNTKIDTSGLVYKPQPVTSNIVWNPIGVAGPIGGALIAGGHEDQLDYALGVIQDVQAQNIRIHEENRIRHQAHVFKQQSKVDLTPEQQRAAANAESLASLENGLRAGFSVPAAAATLVLTRNPVLAGAHLLAAGAVHYAADYHPTAPGSSARMSDSLTQDPNRNPFYQWGNDLGMRVRDLLGLPGGYHDQGAPQTSTQTQNQFDINAPYWTRQQYQGVPYFNLARTLGAPQRRSDARDAAWNAEGLPLLRTFGGDANEVRRYLDSLTLYQNMRVPGIDASYQRWADYFLATDPGRIAEMQVNQPTPSGRTPTTLQDLMTGTGTGTGQRRAIASTERYGFESMFNTLFSPIERRRLAHRGSAHRFLPADQRAADQYGFESLYGTGALFDDYYRAALTNRGSRVQRTSGGGGGRSAAAEEARAYKEDLRRQESYVALERDAGTQAAGYRDLARQWRAAPFTDESERQDNYLKAAQLDRKADDVLQREAQRQSSAASRVAGSSGGSASSRSVPSVRYVPGGGGGIGGGGQIQVTSGGQVFVFNIGNLLAGPREVVKDWIIDIVDEAEEEGELGNQSPRLVTA